MKTLIVPCLSSTQINVESADLFEITLDKNITLSLVNLNTLKEIAILFRQDGTGNRTVTFSSQFTFPDTSAILATASGSTLMKFGVSAGSCTCTFSSHASASGDETFSTMTATTGNITTGNITTLNTTTGNITTVDTNVAAAKLQMSGTTIQAAGTDATVDVNIASKSTGSINLRTNGADQWSVNGSGAFNPATDNSKDIGNESVNPRYIHATTAFIKKGNAASNGYGLLSIKSFSVTQAVSGTSSTLAVTVPTGSVIIGCQLRNDTAIVGQDAGDPADALVSYSTSYGVGGASQLINAAITLAINTKVNKFFDVNADSNITTGALTIVLTPNAVDADAMSFTSGTVTAIVYYYELTSITDFA